MPTALLFSYGTLQLRDVQLACYGRELAGDPDALTNYRIDDLAIGDAGVVGISGKAVHPIARHSGNPADRIAGLIFKLSEAELSATDEYEVEPYRRIEVVLESGRTAWVYAGPPLKA